MHVKHEIVTAVFKSACSTEDKKDKIGVTCLLATFTYMYTNVLNNVAQNIFHILELPHYYQFIIIILNLIVTYGKFKNVKTVWYTIILK